MDEPKREKYWKELNTDEKVERMRQVIKNIQNDCHYCRNTVGQLFEDFHEHSHSDGKVVRPSKKGSGLGIGGISTANNRLNINPDEVYF